jgi:two-component system sensor histidine kinase CreC
MHLGIRVLLAFFVLSGLTAWFVLRVVLGEVQPAVREVVEELLVDTAHLVAELAADELQQGANLAPLAARLQRLGQREVDARIWGLRKQRLDLRIYVTDLQGRVLIDTATPSSVGQDYSQWNDVLRTLRGDYGARTSGGVMQVAAPVFDAGGRRIAVVSVGKPSASLEAFIGRAERRVARLGAVLLAVSLLLGGAVTAWLILSVRRLRAYALQVQAGSAAQAPRLAGELGELARAMDAMRARLEGREHWERRVRALTHELKSPLTGLRGAGELLQEELPAADRQRFAQQVVEQSERLQQLVERLLELSKLEARAPALDAEPLRLDRLLQTVAAQLAPRLQQRQLRLSGLEALPPILLRGDAEALQLLAHNLLANAIDFAPAGTAIELQLQRHGQLATLSVRDQGPGLPPELMSQLGQPWFSLPRPDGRKGSGLGLAIARQVAALHQGELRFEAAAPGLRVLFTFRSHSP